MHLGIAGGHVSHHLLPTCTSSSSSQTRSLRRSLPDAIVHGSIGSTADIAIRLMMVHIRLCATVGVRIAGWVGRRRCRQGSMMVMMRVRVHREASFNVTEGAHGGLSVVIERHD